MYKKLTAEQKRKHIESLNWDEDKNTSEEFKKLAKEFMIKHYDLLEKLVKND